MPKGVELSLNGLKRLIARSNIFQLLAEGDTKSVQQQITPRHTTTTRDALAAGDKVAGLLIYNTTTNKLNFWNGTAWEVVTSA